VGRYASAMSSRASPRLALGFSSVAHSYSHLFMVLYPTVVLALEPVFAMAYGDLLLLAVAGNVLFGAMALPAGWLGDRWSAEGMMAIFFLGTGAAAILTGLASSPLGLGLGLASIGFFASIYHPVGIAWLVRNAVNRGRALGINGIFGNLGTAGAALVAGALTELVDWRAAFIVPGVVCVVTGVAFLALVRGGRIAAAAVDRKPEPPASRSDMVRAFWVLSLTMLITGVVYQVVQWSLPKLVEERVVGAGTGVGVTGGVVSLVFLFAIGSQILGGWLADRFDLRKVYLLAFLVQAPLLLGLALASGAAVVPVAVALVFVNTGNTPGENALLARYAPARWRATAFGAKFVLALGVAAASTALVAAVHSWTGSFAPLLGGLALLASIAAVTAAGLPRATAPRSAPVPVPAE